MQKEGHDISQEIWEATNLALQHEEAPLWSANLVSAPSDAPCRLEEVKVKYPHQYSLILRLHHSFVDGLCMSQITQRFVEILNQVIGGCPVDSSDQLGELASSEKLELVKRKIRKEFEEDPESLLAMQREIRACDSEPILLKAFPKPGGEPSTAHVFKNIDSKLFRQFTTKCMAEGVTFTSGLQAVINTAMVEMIRDVGEVNQEESFDISINLATDIRRYVTKNPWTFHGLHARPSVHRVRTPLNVRDHFWDYTRSFHQTLTPLLRSGLALQQEVAREMMTDVPVISPQDYFATPPPVIRDYGLTSVGDLTAIIPGEGDHLQLTDIILSSAAHRYLYSMIHHIYTFRGHCPYSFSYDTSYISHDTANLLVEKMFAILPEVSQ